MSSTMQARDRRIPLYFFVFFGLVFAVDAVMITIAIKTNPGTITDHPYEKGLAYNSIVEAEKAQQDLGWKGSLQYQDGKAFFSLSDADGKAIVPDAVTVSFTRPSQGGMDFSATMTPAADGQYTATPVFPTKGLWEMRVYAKKHDNTYQQAKRIVAQ